MTRYIPLIAALLAMSCSTDGYRSDLIITTVVTGEATTSTTGTTCKFNASDPETLFPTYVPGVSAGAAVGFVVDNQLTDTSTLNTVLRTNSALFNPNAAVVDYQIVGGGTIPEQRIAVSSASINAGEINAVVVPVFLPAAVQAALPANGQVQITAYIEGKLQDSTTVKTTLHDYVIQVCTGAGCSATACF
jgi:hypothetical protein